MKRTSVDDWFWKLGGHEAHPPRPPYARLDRAEARSSRSSSEAAGRRSGHAAWTWFAGALWTSFAGALLVALAVLLAVLLWKSRGWLLVHDAAIMHYVAWRISEGAVPYRDLFDMNMPGAYVIHLAVLRGLGPGDGAWRVFDLGWLAAASATIAALARPWGPRAAAGGALFFAVYHLAGGAWEAGQRDFLLCPFLVIGGLVVARWCEGYGSPAELFVGGVALGAGVTIKPHAVAYATALAILLVFFSRRAGRGAVAAAAAFVVGLAVLPTAVVGWLAGLGALGSWWTLVVDYLIPLYSQLGRPTDWAFYRWHVWLPIGAAVVVSVGRVLVEGRFGPRHAVAALGVVYGLAHYLGQGKGWEYHLYPLAAFAVVLACSELDRPMRPGRLASAAALGASLVVALALLGAKGVDAADNEWILDKERRVDAVVADLGPRLAAGDRVQVLDTTEGGVHALLRLRVSQPTRFLYDFHFFHDVDDPMILTMRAEFIAALHVRPPRFIVLFRDAWPGGGFERVERFPALGGLLAESYRIEVRRDGYLIYAKRDDS